MHYISDDHTVSRTILGLLRDFYFSILHDKDINVTPTAHPRDYAVTTSIYCVNSFLKVGVSGVGVDFSIGDYVTIKCVLYRDEGKRI